MNTTTQRTEPQLGRALLMAVVLILLLRELFAPRTLVSGVKNVFDVPKDLLRLILRALMIFKPFFDLIGSLFAIARAALLLTVFGVVITRLLDSIGVLRAR